jgi:DNA polymerase/3'-5' exonuclease PolX
MVTTSFAGENEFIARTLEEVARSIDSRHGNAHRIAAYRRAAQRIRELNENVAEVCSHRGDAGLQQLLGVGESLTETISSLIRTGRLPESKGLNPTRIQTQSH